MGADPAEDGGPAGRFHSGAADFIRITPDLARDGPTARRHDRLATLHVTVNHTDEQNIDSRPAYDLRADPAVS